MNTGRLPLLLALGLSFGGCLPGARAWAKDPPAYNYLERSPVRVAILPSVNRTDQPGAQIVVDQAWEKALKKAGFEVVSADRVVTYVAARGMMLSELGHRKVGDLGQDLKVELLLKTEILKWATSSAGERADTTVEVVQRLVEATTGAVLWEHRWVTQEISSNEGLGKLIDAAIDVATDKASRMAERAVKKMSAPKLPQPGHARTARRK